jgi:hypothetical protein
VTRKLYSNFASDDQGSGLGEFEALAFPFINRFCRTDLILTGNSRRAMALVSDTCAKAREDYRCYQKYEEGNHVKSLNRSQKSFDVYSILDAGG